MRFSENISIKELLSKLDWDTPYSSSDLQALGLPSTAAARLAKSGWLKRLGRGVYQVPRGLTLTHPIVIFADGFWRLNKGLRLS